MEPPILGAELPEPTRLLVVHALARSTAWYRANCRHHRDGDRRCQQACLGPDDLGDDAMIRGASTERPAAGDSPVGRGGQRPGKGDSEMIESGCERQDLEVPQRYIHWALALSDGTDIELLAGVAAGRLGAFEALYDRYRVIAYSVALRIAIDPTAAEDVVQEAFTSAWRNAARYDHARGSVKTWLLAIVHHRAVDAVRRRRPTTHLPELEETTAIDRKSVV